MVVSFPITCEQAIIEDSEITGLTFPGIILLPGCNAFNLISEIPESGPEFIHLKSFAILIKDTAIDLRCELYKTASSCELRPSNLFFLPTYLTLLSLLIAVKNSFANNL